MSDLTRAQRFYRDGLGLKTQGVIGSEFIGDDTHASGTVVMFHLDGGLILALYPRTELAKDANIPTGPPKGGEFSIGHAVATREEVDDLLAEAERAGATLTDEPYDRTWGLYSGYFRDPDGHLWEIMWILTSRVERAYRDRDVAGDRARATRAPNARTER